MLRNSRKEHEVCMQTINACVLEKEKENISTGYHVSPTFATKHPLFDMHANFKYKYICIESWKILKNELYIDESQNKMIIAITDIAFY